MRFPACDGSGSSRAMTHKPLGWRTLAPPWAGARITNSRSRRVRPAGRRPGSIWRLSLRRRMAGRGPPTRWLPAGTEVHLACVLGVKACNDDSTNLNIV